MAYNPYFLACFFSQNSVFSLIINQPIVFFSRLISTVERAKEHLLKKVKNKEQPSIRGSGRLLLYIIIVLTSITQNNYFLRSKL
jgi:hypothetical protein